MAARKKVGKAPGKRQMGQDGEGRVRARSRRIVLAAGKGTRMRSARAKVLHELLGPPARRVPRGLARQLGATPVVAVLGHQREPVEAALARASARTPSPSSSRSSSAGTGHAVRLAMPALAGFEGIVVVLYGDVPLLRRETLQALVGTARRYHCLAIVTGDARRRHGLRARRARLARARHRHRRAEGRDARGAAPSARSTRASTRRPRRSCARRRRGSSRRTRRASTT